MNRRNVPFQFMSIDPAKRQAELEKRFGLSKSSDNKMHLDLGNPGVVGMRKEPSSASSSPRLQHRVPIFVEGRDEPPKADANPTNVDAGQKPRVRVVPIEVETDDMVKRKARAFSGDPYTRGHRLNNTRPRDPWFDSYEPKPEFEPSMSAGPRVCNIPIKVERASSNAMPKSPVKKVPIKKEPVVKTVPVQKESVPKPPRENGCNASKQSPPPQEQVPSLPHEVSLKKIAVVLDKLGGYKADVEKFSGTSKEKQYRYLDEMLTRLMLDLDNVETMGNEDVRLKRKDAIRKVQHCIDLLESKVCDNQVTPSQEMTVEPNIEGGAPSDDHKVTDEEMKDTDGPKLDEEMKEAEVSKLTDEEMNEEDVPKLDEVEMKDSEEETKPAEVKVEEVEFPATQPGVDDDLLKPSVNTEIVQAFEISEVVEGDANLQEEIVSEPIVNDLSESVENCPDETLAEESEIKIAEVQGDSDANQSMEVDEGEEKGSVAETVTELEVDNCNSDVSEPNSIPNSKTDIKVNNQIVNNGTSDEGMTESNLSHTCN